MCARDTERLVRTCEGQQEPAVYEDPRSAYLASCASAVDAFRNLIKRNIVGYSKTAPFCTKKWKYFECQVLRN